MSTDPPPIPPEFMGDRGRTPTRQDVLDLGAFVKSHDDSTTQLQSAIEALAALLEPDAMARTMTLATKETISDAELMSKLVDELYSGLVKRGRHDGTLWIGARIMAWLSSALVGLGIFLIWHFGLKK